MGRKTQVEACQDQNVDPKKWVRRSFVEHLFAKQRLQIVPAEERKVQQPQSPEIQHQRLQYPREPKSRKLFFSLVGAIVGIILGILMMAFWQWNSATDGTQFLDALFKAVLKL